MTTQEKRFIRREVINYCLQKYSQSKTTPILDPIKDFVRWYEVKNYGCTLPVYSQYVIYSK
jgi:hypothetical protein